jgi:hypothetical protein
MIKDKRLTPALSTKLKGQSGKMSSYAVTHESAVPTSASCLMRPTMACACVWRSLQSGDRHTLCCAECPLMYVLRVRVRLLVHKTARVDCGHSPRQPPTSGSSVRLACIRDAVSYNRHRLPRAWIRSQTSWLRRKRWTGDVNLHLRSAPWRIVTALY